MKFKLSRNENINALSHGDGLIASVFGNGQIGIYDYINNDIQYHQTDHEPFFSIDYSEGHFFYGGHSKTLHIYDVLSQEHKQYKNKVTKDIKVIRVLDQQTVVMAVRRGNLLKYKLS